LSVDPAINGELEHRSLPAAAPVRVIEPRGRLLPALPLSGSLVAAAGGFLAGAVALATMRAFRTRRMLRRGRRRAGKEVLTRNVVATRSFLVDVHLLGR
jgi:hypothetical protein